MIKLTFNDYKRALLPDDHPEALKNVSNPNIYTNNKHELFTKDGLYSEQIFGPVHNYKCQCGKVFGKINKGKRCEECGVLCDSNELRSKTFAKIQFPENIYVINPTLKNVLKTLYGLTSINTITNKAAYNSNKENPYYYSLNKEKLVKENFLKNDDYIDIPVFDIGSLKKLFYYMKDEVLNDPDELIDPETGEFLSPEELAEKGIEIKYKFRHLITKIIKKELLDFVFLNFIPVTDPNSRQVIKISSTKIVPHPISKAYIEILKNISKGTSILDNLYNENSDFFGNTVYKYQTSVDEIYKEILQFNFQKEKNYMRESMTGKTIEFSQRAVLIPNPVLKPYQLGLSSESIQKLFLPELLRFLYVKYEDKEIEFMKDGKKTKTDIVEYLQYIYDKFNSDFDIEISPEDYREFLEKHIKDFRMFFERQPVLWRYSTNGHLLARSFDDSKWDELNLPNLDYYRIPEKYHYLLYEILGDLKNILKGIKQRSPGMFDVFMQGSPGFIITLIHKRIREIENEQK